MSKDHFITAAFFLLVTSISMHWREVSSTVSRNEWQPVLQALRHECDPANPEADYSFVQTALPTERKRAAILQRCRELGPDLVPWIKAARENETNDELRGMLTVFAAALGDAESIKPAAWAMTGDDFPALKITAAKALLSIHDTQLDSWFRLAMNDWHFVVNGGCGFQRERFYPVRAMAAKALTDRNLIAEGDDEMLDRVRNEQRERLKQLEREILRSN